MSRNIVHSILMIGLMTFLFVNTLSAHPNGNIPLNVIPAQNKTDLPMVFMISGDGGWNGFTQSLSKELAARGMSVVCLDAKKYFWKAKTPEKATEDISRVLTEYMLLWQKRSFILVGYSFGACIVPFIANRISPDMHKQLKEVVCLSPDEDGDFEIHISDMMNWGRKQYKYDVMKEIQNIRGVPAVCFFGNRENTEIRNRFSESGIDISILPGDHHFNDAYIKLTDEIYKTIQPATK